MGRVAELYEQLYLFEEEPQKVSSEKVMKEPAKKQSFYIRCVHNGSYMYVAKKGVCWNYAQAKRFLLTKAEADRKAVLMSKNSKNGYQWKAVSC